MGHNQKHLRDIPQATHVFKTRSERVKSNVSQNVFFLQKSLQVFFRWPKIWVWYVHCMYLVVGSGTISLKSQIYIYSHTCRQMYIYVMWSVYVCLNLLPFHHRHVLSMLCKTKDELPWQIHLESSSTPSWLNVILSWLSYISYPYNEFMFVVS